MAAIDTLVLDKTGTITVGKPEVVQMHSVKSFDPALLYALVQNSKHPVARGVGTYIKEHYDVDAHEDFESYKQIPASGIEARKGGQNLFRGQCETSWHVRHNKRF